MKRSAPIHSMTGYGKGASVVKNRRVFAEIKSVNNRFLDLQFRGAHLSAETENLVSNRVKQAVERGTLTVAFNIIDPDATPIQPELNTQLLDTYKKIFDQACKQLKTTVPTDIPFLLNLPEAIRLVPKAEADAALGKQILSALDNAIAAFNKMRAKEGDALAQDLEKRILHISELSGQIEAKAPERTEAYKARLEKKITDLLQTAPDDTLRNRLLSEVTLMADKTDTSEETTRLRSHLDQFLSALKQGGAVGKKLNFLQQEIYREANTVSSKTPQPDVTQLCIAIKEESEKIREQIQNLE